MASQKVQSAQLAGSMSMSYTGNVAQIVHTRADCVARSLASWCCTNANAFRQEEREESFFFPRSHGAAEPSDPRAIDQRLVAFISQDCKAAVAFFGASSGLPPSASWSYRGVNKHTVPTGRDEHPAHRNVSRL